MRGGLLIDEIFIYYLGNKLTVACNINDSHKILYQFDFLVSFSKYYKKGLILAKNKENVYCDIELKTGKIVKQYPPEFLSFFRYTTEYFIGYKNFASIIFVADSNHHPIWQRDISEECQYENTLTKGIMEKGRINNTFLYKDKYIIVSTYFRHSLCLELATGKELWRAGGTITYYALDGNIAYCSTGRSLRKLNLDTGAEENYFGVHNAFADFEYEGYPILWPNAHDMHFHEGRLWFLIYDNGTGFSFIFMVNPENGDIEWRHKVDTKYRVSSMKFHNNRLYLNGSQDLFVYEKI